MARLAARVRLLVVAAVAVGVGGSAALRGERPPPDPETQTAQQLAEQAGRSQGRTRGAKLSIEATYRRPTVEVRWTIDYTGPRPPLVIPKPSLERPAGSELLFFVDANGVGRRVVFAPSQSCYLNFLHAADFARADGRTPVTGTLTVGADTPPGLIRTGDAPVFVRGQTVWVQLRHRAGDRGNSILGEPHQDAWTGELLSNVVRVGF